MHWQITDISLLGENAITTLIQYLRCFSMKFHLSKKWFQFEGVVTN